MLFEVTKKLTLEMELTHPLQTLALDLVQV